ncbi:MAG TPA: endonuclease/exonuclease/phosphatase family protein [Verrucomicrobiota bacterium]|nr:endonuclease/exonuclease/phosphatase family protein [Verrucomicrobiota bacterium]HNU51394.1 endonuclease/exonuclease/phosphatase family protein [Verrucomicrobiota bacterium]
MKRFLQPVVRWDGLLDAVAVLAMVSTVAAFAASWWWLCELTVHFRWQYAACLVLLGVGRGLQGRWRWAAVYGVGAMVNVLAVSGGCGPSAAVADHGGVRPDLRVLLVNVHTANTEHTRVEAYVNQEAPDVVVLIEVDSRWLVQLTQLARSYPHRIEAPRNDNFGIALFSRLPLEYGRVVDLGEAGVPSVEARVRVGENLVWVVGTHPLPPSHRENARLRDQQLHAVAAHMAGLRGPRVLVGDLNATPWSPVFRALVAQSGLLDTRCGRGWQPTWPAGMPLLWIPLDHALISDDLAVWERRVGPSVGSDHYPLLVGVSWKKSVASEAPIPRNSGSL